MEVVFYMLLNINFINYVWLLANNQGCNNIPFQHLCNVMQVHSVLQKVTAQLDRLEEKVDKFFSKRSKKPEQRITTNENDNEMLNLTGLSDEQVDVDDRAILGDPKSKRSVRCDTISSAQVAEVDGNPRIKHALALAKSLFDIIFHYELETRPTEVSASDNAESKEHLNKTYLERIRSK